jgi:hypothetical protein
LRAKYDFYSLELARLKDAVQMELRISGTSEVATAPTGTEYLRSKQEQSRTLQADSEKARTALGDLVLEWKERPADKGVRCYALVRRSDVANFRQKLASAQLGASSAIFSSGPWPATEFLHD